MKHALLALATLPLALAGCATPPPPPPAAVLQFQPLNACTATISLDALTSLTAEQPTGELERGVELTAASPCYIDSAGQARPYAVFSLPSDANAASVLAGARIESARTFPPVVEILSSDMVVRRTFTSDDFANRGRTQGVLFRPHAGEAYIVISVDAARIPGAWNNYAYDPGLPMTAEELAAAADEGLPFSYEGTVFARVYFSDPANSD